MSTRSRQDPTESTPAATRGKRLWPAGGGAVLLALMLVPDGHITDANAASCIIDNNDDGTADGNGGADSDGTVTNLACGVFASTDGGLGATAIGRESHAHANNATAVGFLSGTSPAFSPAEGMTTLGARAGFRGGGRFSTAIGAADVTSDTVLALGDFSIAIGGGESGIVFREPASATGTASIAIGTSSEATRLNGVALGVNTFAGGIDSVTVGAHSVSFGHESTALGPFAAAGGNNSVAIGFNADANIDGVATGFDNAVAIGHNAFAPAESATALGREAVAGGLLSTAVGGLSRATGGNSSAFGRQSLASGENSIAAGFDSRAIGDNSAAYGRLSRAEGDGSAAFGLSSRAGNLNAAAYGRESLASGARGAAFGFQSTASGPDSTAIGRSSVASGDSSAALGRNSMASGGNSLALGVLANASAGGAVALGAGSVANVARTVSVGAAGAERRIVNVAPGLNATDAVNLAQLQAAVGSNSTFTTGSLIAGVGAVASHPDGTALGENARATGEAATAVGTRAEATGDEALALGADSVASGDRSTAVGSGAEARHADASAFGHGAETSRPRQIVLGTGSNTYTLPGLTSRASRAAQSGPIEVVTTDRAGNLASDGGALFRDVGKALEGVALGIALDAPYVPADRRFAVAGRWGGFEGENALGLNAAVRINEVFQLDAGVAFGLSEDTYGGTVGGTFSW